MALICSFTSAICSVSIKINNFRLGFNSPHWRHFDTSLRKSVTFPKFNFFSAPENASLCRKVSLCQKKASLREIRVTKISLEISFYGNVMLLSKWRISEMTHFQGRKRRCPCGEVKHRQSYALAKWCVKMTRTHKIKMFIIDDQFLQTLKLI